MTMLTADLDPEYDGYPSEALYLHPEYKRMAHRIAADSGSVVILPDGEQLVLDRPLTDEMVTAIKKWEEELLWLIHMDNEYDRQWEYLYQEDADPHIRKKERLDYEYVQAQRKKEWRACRKFYRLLQNETGWFPYHARTDDELRGHYERTGGWR